MIQPENQTYSAVDATVIGDPRFGALFRRTLLPTQIERAVDQTDVTIGLRKIAQHATGQWIESSASRPTSLQRESKRANSLCASA